MSCLTEFSRSLVPGLPWKYLLVTMFVAVCGQFLGTSTPSWRKMVAPFSLPISAVRFAHSTMSTAEVLPSVKRRANTNPFPALMWSVCVPVSTDLACNAGFTVAIRPSALRAASRRGDPSSLLLLGSIGSQPCSHRAVRRLHSLQNAASLRIGVPCQRPLWLQNPNIQPEPPHFGRLHGNSLTAHPSHRKRSRLLLFGAWCLAATWFLSRSFPRNPKKPAWALPRSPKVSDAKYQLLSNPCQEKNAKCR